MDPQLYDDLRCTLEKDGPVAAMDRLCATLRDAKDYSNLFYALLMKKRHELGVSPIPTGPAQELPTAVHEEYEEAIRHAGRLVGELYLQEGNIAHAWAFYRMLGEPEPVRAALEKANPGDGED